MEYMFRLRAVFLFLACVEKTRMRSSEKRAASGETASLSRVGFQEQKTDYSQSNLCYVIITYMKGHVFNNQFEN